MFLGVFVLAEIVMMLGLMVVMRSRVVMSSGLVMMLASRMLGCLCHFIILSLNVIGTIPVLERPREARKLRMHSARGVYGDLPLGVSQLAI